MISSSTRQYVSASPHIEEEAAYGIQATDLRLCEVDDVSPEDSASASSRQIFAGHWDRVDRDLVFLCNCNGVLHTLNTLALQSRHYQVFFQPPMSGLSKPTAQHWDKLMTIPGHPGHILFVLGVSRSVYHCTLPAAAGPFERNTFVFGKEVLQLWSHSARVTSLAASVDGAVLASGDEEGGVRLVLYDKLSGLIESSIEAAQARQTVVDPHLGILRFRAHKGSVFAMEWLSLNSPTSPAAAAIGAGGARKQQYCLCTGSSDFTLCVWRATVDGRGAIAVQCMQQLSTITSHILTLHSCSLGKCNGVLLAAGTNIGSVYAWHLSEDYLESTQETTDTTAAGKCTLYSFVHSSQHPVVQVSVSSTAAGEARRVLLAASDTVGVVRTHTGLLLVNTPDPPVPQQSQMQGQHRPIELTNEALFPCAVVSCAFQPASPSALPRGLLVCTLDGEVKLYSDEIFTKKLTKATSMSTATSTGASPVAVGVLGVLSSGSSPDATTEESFSQTTGSAQSKPRRYSAQLQNVGVDIGSSTGALIKEGEEDVASNVSGVSVGVSELDEPLPRSTPPPRPLLTSTRSQQQSSERDSAVVGGTPRLAQDNERQLVQRQQREATRTPVSVAAMAASWSPPEEGVKNNSDHPQKTVGARQQLAPSLLAVTSGGMRAMKGTRPATRGGDSSGYWVNTESIVQGRVQPPPAAFLTHPSVHSSDALKAQASRLTARLDSDDVSVGSVSTTRSARVEAATAAVNSAGNARRYTSALARVSDAAVMERLPARRQLPKQVDPEWLRRRTELAPPPEVLKRLESAPPDIKLFIRPDSGTTSKYKAPGLRMAFDETTLQPSFTCELNASDLFGDVDDIGDSMRIESEERYRRFTQRSLASIGPNFNF